MLPDNDTDPWQDIGQDIHSVTSEDINAMLDAWEPQGEGESNV